MYLRIIDKKTDFSSNIIMRNAKKQNLTRLLTLHITAQISTLFFVKLNA